MQRLRSSARDVLVVLAQFGTALCGFAHVGGAHSRAHAAGMDLLRAALTNELLVLMSWLRRYLLPDRLIQAHCAGLCAQISGA